jgi:hypothetical protein
MQRADSEQEQLWNDIQARKQQEPPRSNGHRNGVSNGSGPSTDALLVNLLWSTLEEDQVSAPAHSAATRALLKAAISADTAARKMPQAQKPKFWQVSNRRQCAAVVALCLVTVAALGYLFWYFGPIQSMCHESPSQPASSQAPVVAPSKPGTTEKAPPKSGTQSALPVVGPSVKIPTIDCGTPQAK